jgi:hypothetical protein
MADERENPMTEAQRQEIKRLCHQADIPDKSGELYTEQTAQALIGDLRAKAAAMGHAGTEPGKR